MPVSLPIQGILEYLDPGPESEFRSIAVFDNLLFFDEATEKYAPLLARAWRHIDDRTLELDLRTDVTWHDGERFSADDVVSTVNWLVDPQTKIPSKGDFEWIERAEKLSPDKVRIIAKKPTPYDESVLSEPMHILPDHIAGKLPVNERLGFSMKPVGTGPFSVVSVDPNKGVLLKKNADYKHGGAKPGPHVGNLDLLFVPDQGTRIALFLAGDLDMLDRQVTLDQIENLAEKPGVKAQLVQGPSVSYLAIDAAGRSGVKALTDLRVRKALFMAIDSRELFAMEAGSHKLNRDIPDAMCFKDQYGCDYTAKRPGYDPEGAKKLLAEAGYPNGLDLELGTFATNVANHAVVVASQWSRVGIRAHINKYTVPTWRNALRDAQLQTFVGGHPIGKAPDVAAILNYFYDVPTTSDYHGDEELKAMVRQAATMMDPAKRRDLDRKIFDRATENLYFVPIGPRPQSVVYRDDVDVQLSRYVTVGFQPGGVKWR